MNNTRDIKLSDIADEVQYIPLETNSECILSKGYTIVPTKDYFFIADGEKPLFVFDREGKFVRKIGKVGKGPGEFHNGNQFHIDGGPGYFPSKKFKEDDWIVAISAFLFS